MVPLIGDTDSHDMRTADGNDESGVTIGFERKFHDSAKVTFEFSRKLLMKYTKMKINYRANLSES
jgi:hypothetical protein